MKIPIIKVLIIVFLYSYSSAFCQQTDLENSNLSENIKSIRETTYSTPVHGANIGKKTITTDNYTIYTSEGYKQKTSEYKNGVLFAYTLYNYNQNNIKISSYEYNANNSLYLTIVYKSNEKGTEIKAYFNRELQKTYDDQRQSIEVEYETYYSKLFTSILYKMDFKGFILEEKYFSEDSVQLHKYMYKYDYKHNRVEVKYYNSSGNVSWRKKIKYDSDGNIAEIKLFESNRIAIISKFTYEFDPHKNWITREETRKLYDNFFSDNLNDNTVITKRKIEYY